MIEVNEKVRHATHQGAGQGTIVVSTPTSKMLETADVDFAGREAAALSSHSIF